jgi:3-oxoadipate enol-lactonase
MQTILEKPKSLTINSLNVSYFDLGKSALPIIFIHGFPFNKSSWEPQLKALSGEFRTIAYDIRGFGQSGSGDEKPSIDLFASDLIAFLDALKIKKCIACGLSMGGYILMNAAGRFPERFHALVFCDTQCIADSEEGKEKRFKTIQEIESGGLGNFIEKFTNSVLCEKTKVDKSQIVSQTRDIVRQASEETVTQTLLALAERKETCSAIKKLSMPALVICGKEDTLTPVTQSEFLFNNIGGSDLKVLADAGHLSNIEQPEEFNRHLNAFCQKITAGQKTS